MMGSLSPLYHCTTGGFSIGQCGAIDVSRFQGDEQQSVPSVASGKKRGSQDIPGGRYRWWRFFSCGKWWRNITASAGGWIWVSVLDNFYLGDGWDHSWSGHGWKPPTIEYCLRPMVRYFGPYAYPFPVLYRWFIILLTEHALCASTSSWEQGSKCRVHVLRSSSQDQWSSDIISVFLWSLRCYIVNILLCERSRSTQVSEPGQHGKHGNVVKKKC